MSRVLSPSAPVPKSPESSALADITLSFLLPPPSPPRALSCPHQSPAQSQSAISFSQASSTPMPSRTISHRTKLPTSISRATCSIDPVSELPASDRLEADACIFDSFSWMLLRFTTSIDEDHDLALCLAISSSTIYSSHLALSALTLTDTDLEPDFPSAQIVLLFSPCWSITSSLLFAFIASAFASSTRVSTSCAGDQDHEPAADTNSFFAVDDVSGLFPEVPKLRFTTSGGEACATPPGPNAPTLGLPNGGDGLFVLCRPESVPRFNSAGAFPYPPLMVPTFLDTDPLESLSHATLRDSYGEPDTDPTPPSGDPSSGDLLILLIVLFSSQLSISPGL